MNMVDRQCEFVAIQEADISIKQVDKIGRLTCLDKLDDSANDLVEVVKDLFWVEQRGG